MSKKTIVLLVIIGIILVVVIALGSVSVGKYNTIVAMQENISGSYAEIENQLVRRFDLIPDLVSVANKYAEHEEEVYTAIANARAAMTSAGNINDKLEANSELSSAISRLLIVQEKYPELKADKQYIALMDEMSGTENRIAVARRNYNETVKTYNTEIKRFPSVIVANFMGAEASEYLDVEDSKLEKPDYNI